MLKLPGGCMLKLPVRVAGGLDHCTGATAELLKLPLSVAGGLDHGTGAIAEPWELQVPTIGGTMVFGIGGPNMLCLEGGFVGVNDDDRLGEPGKGGAVLDIDKLDMDRFKLLVDKFKLLLSLNTCVLALLPEGVA